MIDERTEELASLHALDLLEGAELAAFETQLASDPQLQALVRELREAAAMLALTAPAAVPDAALKARVLQQIGQAQPRETGRNTILPFRLPTLIPWAAAAGFALVAAWLGQDLLATREEAANQRTEARLAQLVLRDTANRLEAERIVLNQQMDNSGRQLADTQRQLATTASEAAAANQRVAALNQQLKAEGDLAQFNISTLSSMLGNSPQAVAVAVWNPSRQEGLLAVEKLPALAQNQDYQLWVVDPKYQNPVNGGVFTVDANGVARVQFKADQPISAINAFAVTLERKGGVPKAEGPFVLLSH